MGTKENRRNKPNWPAGYAARRWDCISRHTGFSRNKPNLDRRSVNLDRCNTMNLRKQSQFSQPRQNWQRLCRLC